MRSARGQQTLAPQLDGTAPQFPHPYKSIAAADVKPLLPANARCRILLRPSRRTRKSSENRFERAGRPARLPHPVDAARCTLMHAATSRAFARAPASLEAIADVLKPPVASLAIFISSSPRSSEAAHSVPSVRCFCCFNRVF